MTPEPKTWLTRCPATGNDPSLGGMIHGGDASANAIRDPGRDVTPIGTPHCKNDGSRSRPRPRTGRSSLADRTNRPQNLRGIRLGAGPRAREKRLPTRPRCRYGSPSKRRPPTPRSPPELRPPPLRRRVPVAVAGTDRVAPADALDPIRSTDTGGSPANAATAEPTGCTPRCSIAIADATAQTPVRTP
jgi:hypothetical protein